MDEILRMIEMEDALTLLTMEEINKFYRLYSLYDLHEYDKELNTLSFYPPEFFEHIHEYEPLFRMNYFISEHSRFIQDSFTFIRNDNKTFQDFITEQENIYSGSHGVKYLLYKFPSYIWTNYHYYDADNFIIPFLYPLLIKMCEHYNILKDKYLNIFYIYPNSLK